MSPRVAQKNQPELPLQRTQPGRLGCMPASGLAFSLLCEDLCDALICFRDDACAQQLRENDAVPLVMADAATSSEDIELSLDGCWFNGLSDAFFRGKLPQALLLTLEAPHQREFLEELADYCEKLAALGYFLERPDPVDALIPCIALAADACCQEAFFERLSVTLRAISTLDHADRRRIQEKFMRMTLEDPPPASDAASFWQAASVADPQKVVTPAPIRWRLAGGSPTARMTLQAVLLQKGFAVSLETRGGAPARRLDWQACARVMLRRALPAVAARTQASVRETNRWRRDLIAALAAAAQTHGLLARDETAQSVIETLQVWTPPSAKEAAKQLAKGESLRAAPTELGAGERVALETLARWAQNDPQGPFAALLAQWSAR